MFPIYWMCMIILNMDIFDWILVLAVLLSLRAVMTCTLLYFNVSFWLDTAYKLFWNVIGSFIPIMRINKLVLFIAGMSWFHGILFFDWEIYDMFWCSQYCDTITIGLPLGGKLTWTSNIPYLMTGWSDRSIFNVGRVEVFVPSTSS